MYRVMNNERTVSIVTQRTLLMCIWACLLPVVSQASSAGPRAQWLFLLSANIRGRSSSSDLINWVGGAGNGNDIWRMQPHAHANKPLSTLSGYKEVILVKVETRLKYKSTTHNEYTNTPNICRLYCISWKSHFRISETDFIVTSKKQTPNIRNPSVE